MVECPDGAALNRLRTELYGPLIALDTAPGVSACAGSGDLVGISCRCLPATSSLTASVLAPDADHRPAYRAEPDPADPLPFEQARDLGSFLAPKTRSGKWARQMEALRRVRDAFDPPSRIAVLGGTDGDGFGSSFVPSTSARPRHRGSRSGRPARRSTTSWSPRCT